MFGVALSRKEGKIACEGNPLLILNTCIRRRHKYGLLERTSELAAHAEMKQRLAVCGEWNVSGESDELSPIASTGVDRRF